MAFWDKVKNIFHKDSEKQPKEKIEFRRISITEIIKKNDADDLVGAAKDLKILLEWYGHRIRKNQKVKGREFIDLILGKKHKDLKNTGFMHWQNILQLIQSSPKQVYPYHKNNLTNAIDFFIKEIKGLNAMYLDMPILDKKQTNE